MQESFDKLADRILAAAAVGAIVLGTVVYHLVEKFPWVDAYYFSVVTLATVGYGDLVPHTTFGKIFTTLYIFIGVGILTAFITQFFKRQQLRRHDRHESRIARKNTVE
jgi:voltage-gated potassium channel Kch